MRKDNDKLTQIQGLPRPPGVMVWHPEKRDAGRKGKSVLNCCSAINSLQNRKFSFSFDTTSKYKYGLIYTSMPSYSSHTDGQLLSLLRDNNEGAFTEIFNRYNKLLFSHVFRKLQDKAESMDIVQEVFIKLWEKRTDVGDGNLAGYLFTIARHKVLNVVSHDKIVEDYKAFILTYKNDSCCADEPIRASELASMIDAEIAALPPRMREAFELSRKQFLSNREIATKLHISEHTVADQIKKSLLRLRTKIGILLLISFL